MKNKSKIYFKVDDLKWIQNEKFKVLEKNLGDEFDLKCIANSFYVRKLFGKRFFTPCLFYSWRQVLVNDLWRNIPLESCIASVSSHYNIGGGLNTEKTLAVGQNPKEAFEKAISILRQFKGVMVNSMRLYELLSPHLNKVFYVPNGVDTDFFKPKKEKQFNKENITIGWVGKIKGAKNFELLNEIKENLNISNVKIKEICPKKNDSSFLNKDQMKEYYREIDFFLCTSWHEGTPNPCLEAASTGVPLITTKVGNMPELVRDGENSFFIDANFQSAKAIIEKAVSLNEDQYYQMSESIRESILSEWTWKKQSENYRKAFRELIK